MNITVQSEAALEDVKRIEEIITSIDRCMKELDVAIDKNIPQRVETQWSTDFKEAWKTYYGDSIQNAMENMRLSAVNLQNAVDAALEYNK